MFSFFQWVSLAPKNLIPRLPPFHLTRRRRRRRRRAAVAAVEPVAVVQPFGLGLSPRRPDFAGGLRLLRGGNRDYQGLLGLCEGLLRVTKDHE